MKRLPMLMLLAAASLLLAPPAEAEEPGAVDRARVLVEIGEEQFTVSDFLLHLKQINPLMDFARLPASEQQHWLDEYVRQKLLARRARAAGLERRPDVRARVEFFTERVLAQAYQEKVMREIPVSEPELEAHYRANADDFRTAPRVLVQHFLYHTPEKAAQARARLEAGAAYTELAAEKHSDEDALLAERGWFTPELLLPELAGPAFALPAGGVSEVVRTGYGYHVLRVEAREESRLREFGEVREQLLDRVRQEKAARLFERLLEDARAGERVRLHAESLTQ
ncbi:MAG: peptidylprolyl isomerase [Candidatus Acidiferrales bacterium]